MYKRITLFFIRLVTGTTVVYAVFVLTQTLQIFPGAAEGFFGAAPEDADWVYQGVESTFLTTADGERIELWRLPGHEPTVKGRAALIFHGNGGSLRNFFGAQTWFSQRGLATYAVEYRGYGRSSGWPSEAGIYEDGSAAMKYITAREGIAAADVIPVGISIGSGPAAKIGATFRTRTMVFFSPFTSLPDLVSELPIFGFLRHFLWYEFPVERLLSAMDSPCIVLIHGDRDTTIPMAHSQRLIKSLPAHWGSRFVEVAGAGHNDLLELGSVVIARALTDCVEERIPQ